MIAAGLGITIMPASYSWPGVTRPSLTGFGLTRTSVSLFAMTSSIYARSGPGFLQALSQQLLRQ